MPSDGNARFVAIVTFHHAANGATRRRKSEPFYYYGQQTGRKGITVAQKNQNAKRNTRASRRAAEEKAAQEKAEQAAKERKQQTIIGAVVVAIIVVLVAIAGFAIYGAIHKNDVAKSTTEEQAYQQLQKVETKPSAADDKGGILISSEGYGKKVSGAPTVAVYMDPLCPGCGEFNRQTDPTLISLVDAGQINLEIHPMSFMDEYSTDEYSSRATGAILYIASNDDNPDHLLKFISNIYAEDFQPVRPANTSRSRTRRSSSRRLTPAYRSPWPTRRSTANTGNGWMPSTCTPRSAPNCGRCPVRTRVS